MTSISPRGGFDDELRDAWNRHLHSIGTARIFEQRIPPIERKNRLLAFVGLAVPLIVGGLVAAGYKNVSLVEQTILIGGILATVQVVVAAWALVAGWDKALQKTTHALVENLGLAADYKEFAKHGTPARVDDKRVLDQRYTDQETRDRRDFQFTDRETRRGFYYAHFMTKSACVECDATPASSEPQKRAKFRQCPTCGGYTIPA